MKTISCLALAVGLLAGVAFAGPEATTVATGGDAQSTYSAAEVGVARRAYRAQCTRYQPADMCECLTSGFAQALSPAEVRLAAAQLSVRFGRDERSKIAAQRALDRNAPRIGFPTIEARSFATERIQTLEADLTPICAAAH